MLLTPCFAALACRDELNLSLTAALAFDRSNVGNLMACARSSNIALLQRDRAPRLLGWQYALLASKWKPSFTPEECDYRYQIEVGLNRLREKKKDLDSWLLEAVVASINDETPTVSEAVWVKLARIVGAGNLRLLKFRFVDLVLPKSGRPFTYEAALVRHGSCTLFFHEIKQ